ncbi:MAG: glycosyltransferase family 4 protein [Rikenellaceae bacterium]
MKVIIQTILPSPYRVDFFNELGKRCELTVIFEGHRPNNGRQYDWRDERQGDHFRAIYLEDIYNEKRVKHKIFSHFLSNEYDIRLIMCYHTTTAMLLIALLKLCGKSYLIESDGAMINPAESRIKRWIKSATLSGAKGYLSSGKSTDDYFRLYAHTDEERIYRYRFTSTKRESLPHSPYSKAQKRVIKERLGIKYDRVIISVGQYIHRKGYDLLLKSLDWLPDDVGVYLIGGVESGEYREIRKSLKLQNIHYLEFMSSQRLAEYYKMADLFVLPTREDIWGLVINEAMSYGLPVITTDRCLGGVELLDGVEGAIVHSEDISALRDSTKGYMESDKKRMAVAARNLRVVREHCIDNMADDHIQIFTKQNL